MIIPLDRPGKLIRREPLKHGNVHIVGGRRTSPVTVCIAARSEGNIIGVSDRMLTSGDIQFEPSATPKLLMLSTSIAVMMSGDAAFNTEIMREVMSVVTSRISQEPTNWWYLKDVADLYVFYRNSAKRKRAEASLLAPLGLTLENYRDELRKFIDEDASQLTRELINYDVPYTSVIITGVDQLGAHIYIIDNGIVSCNDMVGFAAVGIGSRHAESQFMLARHAWNSPLVDTALLAYIAKKRSEIAPGVGKATDMFTIGPGLGTLSIVLPEVIEGFESIYRDLRGKEDKTHDEARRTANDFVARVAEAAEKARGQQQKLDDKRESFVENSRPQSNGDKT